MTEAQEVLKTLKEHPDVFLRMVGFDRRCDVYGEWMRMMLYDKEDETIQASRGTGKTTCVSGALGLSCILYPNEKIAFFRKTDADVTEVISQVQKMLMHENTIALSKLIWGVPVQLTVHTQSAINTNLNSDPRGAVQLVGMGINGSITGKHYDRIFTDDIVNTRDRSSRAERERTKAAYMELQNIKNRGGRIVNTGTPWHQNDCFEIMPPAKKWDWRSLPEIISEEEAEYIKARMTPSLWAANYELRHIASDDVIFTDPVTGADMDMVVGGEAHVDAAYYGEDYTAFSAVQKHDGKYYVYGRIWRKHVEDVTPLIIEDIERLKLTRLHMETNADKGYAINPFRQAGIKCLPYHESYKKYIKITTYLKTAWPDVVFVKGTDELFINQICDYTEDSEHDDAPDSLSSILARGKFRVKPYEPKFAKQQNQRVNSIAMAYHHR